MASNIKIRTLIGPGIKTYIPSITKVRQQILREIPYLQLGSAEIDLKYLQYLSKSKDAIAVLVFDGPQIIGVSTGLPLSDEMPPFQETFIKNNLPLEEYYYFGMSALLGPYRNRGLAHHFFDIREEHVRHLKRFAKICFTSIIPPHGAPRQPEQLQMETFWKKRGYIEHPDMICHYPILDTHFVLSLKFWIKNIPHAPLLPLADVDEKIRESLEIAFS